MTTQHSARDETAIVATDVSKRFGAVAALQGVDLRVRRGASFGLIGPNGAGKTTFIKVLLGISRPKTGTVQLLDGTPGDVHVRRRVGYLPENLQLPAGLTPRAFLRSIARLKGLTRGRSRAELAGLVDDSLHRVGLEESAWPRRMGGFSKGMRQRTGLAAALLGAPDLLVLDEPTDGIDPTGRAVIRAVIQAENRRGATVFLNSHLLAETERICDDIAVMARGRIVQSGALIRLQAGDHYRLDVVDDATARRSCAARGWAWTTGDEGLLRCALDATDPADLSRVLAALLAEGVTIAQVNRDVRSLEDVFAEAVGIAP